MSFISIGSGLLGYVYQILMGRLMSPAEFGLFTAIMALTALISSPMGGVSLAIARHVAKLNAHNHFEAVSLFCLNVQKKGYLASGAIMVFMLLLTDPIKDYLKSPDKAPVFLLILGLSVVILSSINLGILQGSQRFKWLGLTNLVGVTTKILFSASLIYLGLGLNGALLGVIGGSFAIWMMGNQLIKPHLIYSACNEHIHKDNQIGNTLKENLPMVIAGIAFAISTQLDMILVNWYFPAVDAGQYAAASVLGKAVLYLPGGLAIALLPIATEEHTLNAKSSLITKSLFITFAICFLAASFYWVLADTIVAAFYGDAYQNAGAILKWFGFAILPMALIMIVENFLLARGAVLFSWLFLALSPLQVLLAHFFHTEIWMILCSLAASGCLILIVGLILISKNSQKHKVIEI